MRERMKKKKNMIIGGLLAIVFLMSVGYAAFASNLSITGTANTSSWIIKITNIREKTKTAGVTNEGTSYTDLTANFNCELTLPGDSITYEVTVANQGNIDASLKEVTKSFTNNKYIDVTYSGLYEGQMLYKQGAENSTAIMEVTVTFKDLDYEGTFTETITSNISINLDFEQDGNNVDTTKKYLVTYDSQGGSPVESRYVKWDDNWINRVTSVRTGYYLQCWLDASGTRVMTAHTASDFMENENDEGFTLRAFWLPKKYKVIFDSQGGTNVSGSGTDFTWDYSNLNSYTSNYNGHVFDSYYTAPNRQGLKIESNMNIGNVIEYLYGYGVDEIPDNTLTVYAGWIEKEIIINFDKQDGSELIGTQKVKWTQNITVPETPTREGYTFLRWNTAPNGRGKVVTNETSPSQLGISDIKTEQTVYAIWKAN